MATPSSTAHPSCPDSYAEERARLIEQARQEGRREGWDEGVSTALENGVIDPETGRLRLEHPDGRPWRNPHA